MEISLNLMEYRSDLAFWAVLLSISFQFLWVLGGYVFRKSINPMPLVEIILRPVVINLSDKLNREGRSAFALYIRGAIVFFIVLAFITVVGIALEIIMKSLGYSHFVDIILMVIILSPLRVLNAAYSISTDKPLDGAYKYIAQSLNLNLIPSDKHGLRRASCKSLALALSDWFLIPVFIYVVAGVPAAYLFVSLSLFIRVSGQSAFTTPYYYIYNGLKTLFSIPCVLFLFISSCFSTGGKPLHVFRAVTHNTMMVEAALAYAQNITLGGAVQGRAGNAIKFPWVGREGVTAKLTHKDILRVFIQYVISIFIIVATLFAVYAFIEY